MLKPITHRYLYITTLILSFLISYLTLAQVDNIPADNSIYMFLKRMSVSGFLQGYDDTILPLPRSSVESFLNDLDTCKSLSRTDRELLIRFKEKIILPAPGVHNPDIFDNFPQSLISNLTADRQKHLYSYSDSTLDFIIDPLISLKYINTGIPAGSSELFNFGGAAYGSYGNWLGFYLKGTNGIVYGSRSTAEIEKTVAQSYTFNNTGLNYFDYTEGYVRVAKGIVSAELGRERILWGTGYIDRTVLSDNPQIFDFVRFDIAYKKLRYDFLHGWLVQKPVTTYIDSLIGNVKTQVPKYIAISRLGYKPNGWLSFGISQMIIYSGRPFQAAYLNPFLFWESAQRSMNDLDNSFLTFDGRSLILNGFEASSSIIFDDINFKYLFRRGGWDRSNNGIEWQVGTMLTYPILPDGVSLKIEYTQARPYIFSHPGIGEALTYTNNGYLLGTDMQPNSTRFAAAADYRLTSRILLGVVFSKTKHGDNIYDANGNLVKNVGGNVFENFSLYDSYYAPLLDGNIELTDDLRFYLNYEIAFGYYFSVDYRYIHYKFNGAVTDDNILRLSFDVTFE